MSRPGNEDIQWGVQFADDKSVVTQWDGRTARGHAERFAIEHTKRYGTEATVVWRRRRPGSTPEIMSVTSPWHSGEPVPDLTDRIAVEEWLEA